MRPQPLDPFTFPVSTQIAAAHFFAGRYDEASSRAEKALREQANWVNAAASYALAGRLDQARKSMARLREIDPALRVSDLRRMFTFRRPEDIARYEERLRKAGLPE